MSGSAAVFTQFEKSIVSAIWPDGVSRDLSQGLNLAEGSPLATVEGPLVNTQKKCKNSECYSEYRCKITGKYS